MVAAATTAAIIRDVERAVMVSNNRSSDGATQMIVSVAQILSEPSRGISATEYTKNIEILAKITNHIVSSPSTDPIQSFPKMIDTWVKTPEGLADINSFIAAIERRPLESIPPQVKEFLQEAKVSNLVASAETHIEQYQYKMNDNSIGYVTHLVAVDNAIEGLKEAVESRNPELIHQALDSVTTALQEAGRKDFSDNEEDKRVEAIPATAPPDSVVEFKKTDEELPTTPSFEPKEVITDVRPDVPVVPPHDFVPPSTPSIKPLPTHIPPTPSPIPIRLSEALPETKIPSFSPRVDFKPVEPRKRNGFLDRIVNGIKSWRQVLDKIVGGVKACPMGSAVCCCTTEARKVFSKPVEKVSKSFNHAAGCGCSDCATQKLGNANDLDAFLNASPT